MGRLHGVSAQSQASGHRQDPGPGEHPQGPSGPRRDALAGEPGREPGAAPGDRGSGAAPAARPWRKRSGSSTRSRRGPRRGRWRLARISREEMTLLRAAKLAEQSYASAANSLRKSRKPAAPPCVHVPAADRELDETRCPSSARSSRLPPRRVDPAPPAGDRAVVGRSEHRSAVGRSEHRSAAAARGARAWGRRGIPESSNKSPGGETAAGLF